VVELSCERVIREGGFNVTFCTSLLINENNFTVHTRAHTHTHELDFTLLIHYINRELTHLSPLIVFKICASQFKR